MDTCYFCAKAPADPARPRIVTVKKTGQTTAQMVTQYTKVRIPACGACRAAEEAAARGRARKVFACLAAPAIGGALWHGWEGFLVLGGLGFVAALAADGMLPNDTASHRHPQVQQLLKEGWSLN